MFNFDIQKTMMVVTLTHTTEVKCNMGLNILLRRYVHLSVAHGVLQILRPPHTTLLWPDLITDYM